MRRSMRFAMQHAKELRPNSHILISEADHDRLTGLARALLDRAPERAEELLSEMDGPSSRTRRRCRPVWCEWARRLWCAAKAGTPSASCWSTRARPT
ncbi:hypothetical protein [Mesorhizobium sp. ESP6-5]|uniref:hypothetical protein n=1 Tax=Mesorhizobium sp. ESP6-5 TaxID=2876623 RepID=UPI00398C732A